LCAMQVHGRTVPRRRAACAFFPLETVWRGSGIGPPRSRRRQRTLVMEPPTRSDGGRARSGGTRERSRAPAGIVVGDSVGSPASSVGKREHNAGDGGSSKAAVDAEKTPMVNKTLGIPRRSVQGMLGHARGCIISPRCCARVASNRPLLSQTSESPTLRDVVTH
jgi:hypothetical protein